MIELKISFPTIDDALEAVTKLAGITTSNVDIDEAPAKPKKATPAQKAAKATTEEFDEPADKPAAAKSKKAKAKAPSIDALKSHILDLAGDGEDQPTKVKEYVRSFGVTKISDMTEAQRTEAFNGAEEYFAEEGSDESEEDPME